ncbi:hypothetical protein JCM10207_003706 [Rhodosporidiobolus poonsookiae]
MDENKKGEQGGKGKGKGVRGSGRTTQRGSETRGGSGSRAAAAAATGDDDGAPTYVPPSYVPPAGSMRSRAPGRQSIACRGCRRRKVKCDGSKPSCMSCQVIYKEECVYDSAPTAADALALKNQVTDLRSLLDSLVLADPLARDRLLSEYATKTQSDSSPAAAASSVSPPALTVSSQAGPSTGPRSGKRRASVGDGSKDAGPHGHEDEMAAAMLSELSFAASGQVEHFGATSFLHRPRLGSSLSPPVLPDSPSTSIAALDNDRASPLVLSYNVPLELRNHLLDIFFLWQTVHSFVYKPALLRDLDGGPYCNDFLLNVIYAHASRFSDRSAVRTSSSDTTTAGGLFLARAKELLMANLDKPSSIPTAQGLLILGGRECAVGNHAQGFLYTAMGLSMAIDLGVHVDGRRIGASNHDPLDIEVRKRLFWSCYLWDKSISLCLGRAPRFLKGDRTFFGPPPEFDCSEDDVPWRPQFSEMPEGLQQYPYFPFRSGAYFRKMCLLAEIIEDVLLDFYAGTRRPDNEDSLVRYNERLQEWHSSLHPDLVVSPDMSISPPPNRITLNMLYNATVILVNRPFSFAGWGPQLRAGEAQRADSKQRCRQAARTIASLLELYDSTFRFRNMNWLMGYCSYTAATIIVFDVRAPEPDVSSTASAHLTIILDALSSQTAVTPSVQRSIEIIRHLMTTTPPASGTVTPYAPAAKRARASPPGIEERPPIDPTLWTAPMASTQVGAGAQDDQVTDLSSAQLAAFLDTLNPDASSSLTHPFPPVDHLYEPSILPAFPESGPLAWLGASQPEDGGLYNFDWP